MLTIRRKCATRIIITTVKHLDIWINYRSIISCEAAWSGRCHGHKLPLGDDYPIQMIIAAISFVSRTLLPAIHEVITCKVVIWYKTKLHWKPVWAGLWALVGFYITKNKETTADFKRSLKFCLLWRGTQGKKKQVGRQISSLLAMWEQRVGHNYAGNEHWFIRSIKDRSCGSLTQGNRKCTHIRTDQEVRKPCHHSPGACVFLCDLYKGCDVWPTAKVGSPLPPTQCPPGLHSSLDTADDLLWYVYMHHLGPELQCNRIKSGLLFWHLNRIFLNYYSISMQWSESC